jgi:hypothetical protein
MNTQSTRVPWWAREECPRPIFSRTWSGKPIYRHTLAVKSIFRSVANRSMPASKQTHESPPAILIAPRCQGPENCITAARGARCGHRAGNSDDRSTGAQIPTAKCCGVQLPAPSGIKRDSTTTGGEDDDTAIAGTCRQGWGCTLR